MRRHWRRSAPSWAHCLAARRTAAVVTRRGPLYPPLCGPSLLAMCVATWPFSRCLPSLCAQTCAFFGSRPPRALPRYSPRVADACSQPSPVVFQPLFHAASSLGKMQPGPDLRRPARHAVVFFLSNLRDLQSMLSHPHSMVACDVPDLVTPRVLGLAVNWITSALALNE